MDTIRTIIRTTAPAILLLAGVTEASAGSTGRIPSSARIAIQRVKLQSRVAGSPRTGADPAAAARAALGVTPSAGSSNTTASPTILGSPRKVEIISVVGDQIAVDR